MCRQTFCWWSSHVLDFFTDYPLERESEPDHNGSRVYSDQEILTTSEFQRIKHQHVCYYLNIFFSLIFFWYYLIITKYHHYCRFPQMLCNRVLAVCFSDFLIYSLNHAFNPLAFLFTKHITSVSQLPLFLSFPDLHYLIMYIHTVQDLSLCNVFIQYWYILGHSERVEPYCRSVVSIRLVMQGFLRWR